ncbi:transglutaminase family protein [Marivivens sp. LCG002]|uniref:transglutaminase family protein n=1 Tax=Marivivens sp. LCG002 TaxID=3051171 RepID=UPI00255630A4|nr:transglutaminase family protein [Marivivens sp. LCG002]WIV49712.1 transglutaminase family protein [Marivivens sp. LCG002]
MTQTLSIRHRTSYRYDAPVPYALLQLRLKPTDTTGQTVQSWSLDIDGGQVEAEYVDHHCNLVTLVSFAPDVAEVTLTSEGVITLRETHGVLGPHQGFAPMWLFERQTPLTKAGDVCRALTQAATGAVGSLEWLHSLSSVIRAAVAYETGKSEVHWSAEEAAKAGHGVCQDHTHIFIACCRLAHVPARYISGYLLMDDRTEQDATHAWAEAFIEGLGWVGFDVSNGISPDKRYVRIASGLDYAEAAPVTGTRFGNAAEIMDVQLSVQQQ